MIMLTFSLHNSNECLSEIEVAELAQLGSDSPFLEEQ